MARPPDAGKQRLWLDRIRRWQQSQLSVRAFCDRHQLAQANFYLWRRILRERGLLEDVHTPTPRPVTTAAFVQMTVDSASTAAAAIELVLGARRLLRIHPGFDPATLRQLVRLLEEPAC